MRQGQGGGGDSGAVQAGLRQFHVGPGQPDDGGTLTLESEAGKGTCAIVRLPGANVELPQASLYGT
jgi:hypothetical protein